MATDLETSAGVYRITEAGLEPALPLIQRMAVPVNNGQCQFTTNHLRGRVCQIAPLDPALV